MRRALLLLALAMPMAATATCPPVPEPPARQAELMALVRQAPDAATARALTNELWTFWTRAPDAEAQGLLDVGMERRAAWDLEAAAASFDALVGYCPDWAEGYNQRAFVAFLRQDYGAAVSDLEAALERRPDHFAARAGLALALMGLGRIEAARATLALALELNPWLPERDMLPPEAGERL